MKKEDEKNRITLSIAFIAIYLSLIFGLLELFNYDDKLLINQIVYGVFIVHGAVIVFLFFSYLLFSALELDFNKKKEVFLDQEIGEEKLKRFKKTFYNAGVRQIFASFAYPLFIIPDFLRRHFNFHWTWSLLICFLTLLIVYIILYFIFKD